MRKFSPSQLGIISESDNIFRIRVVVSDLNSEYFSEVNSDNSEFFFGHSEFFFRAHSDNSEFFPGIPNYMWKKYGNSSKSCFFHKNIFFSIFRANIRNLLLRAPTHGTYISTPPIHGILTPYLCYIDPPIHGIFNPLTMVF